VVNELQCDKEKVSLLLSMYYYNFDSLFVKLIILMVKFQIDRRGVENKDGNKHKGT
jgi:hypothetical protein